MESINISEAEWVVMEELWQQEGESASQLVAKITKNHSWTAKTIRTLIDRLLKKKAICCDKTGKEYIFSTAISKDLCIKEEGKNFLDKFFKGNIVPLVSHFVENNSITEDELKELKNIISKMEKKK